MRLIAEGRVVAAAELAVRADLAHTAPVVAVPVDDPLEAAVGLFSALRRGHAFFPYDPRRPPTAVLDVLADAAPTPGSPVRLIVATSGSTGTPKGVMLGADALSAAAAASNRRLPLGGDDVWLCCLPLFHIGGLSILTRCAAARACAVLHRRFDAEAVWRNMAGHHVTHISLVPAMLAALLDAAADAPPPPGLRVVLVGGAALSPALAARARAAGWPISATYGLSEAASQVATLPKLGPDWQPGEVGMPLEGVSVDLDDDGRITVAGPTLMSGYVRDGALTPGEGLDGAGRFVTADLGRIDGGGALTVVGRADCVFVTGGENVHPAPIEAVLEQCPGVREAALGARPDAVWGDLLVAVAAGSADAQTLLSFARAHLAGPQRPRAVIKVAALPRTGSGKLDRDKIRELILSRGRAVESLDTQNVSR